MTTFKETPRRQRIIDSRMAGNPKIETAPALLPMADDGTPWLGPWGFGPRAPCLVCQGEDFWKGTGPLICRRCHPPAPGAEKAPSDRLAKEEKRA